MRILVVHHRYRVRGGEDQAVDREVALLRGAGVEVELWERDSRELTGLLAKLNAAVEIPYSEQSRLELAAKLGVYKPDLVHVHNWFPTFTPSIYDACAEARVPVVQTLHNFRIFCASGLLARSGKPCELCLGGSTWPALRHACYRDSRAATFAITRMIDRHRAEDTWNRKVSAFIALSEFSAEKLTTGGLASAKIHVKPNFAFEPKTGRRPEGYALFVGRLSQEKGIRTLVRSWTDMKLPLKIVGDGPLREELETGKGAAVSFLGAQSGESVERLMAGAQFLVVPSECYENFPLVVAEAFSMGLPVLASRIGALGEIIIDGENGVFAQPGEAESFASAARSLAEDPLLLARLSEGARRSYGTHYTPAENLKRLLEIYAVARKAPQTP